MAEAGREEGEGGMSEPMKKKDKPVSDGKIWHDDDVDWHLQRKGSISKYAGGKK
jgi:hypothetical protein